METSAKVLNGLCAQRQKGRTGYCFKFIDRRLDPFASELAS